MIIWITWTLGAGKWTIVDYLVKNKWFVHLSVRAYLIKEIEKRWMPVNRDSMVEVANDLRAKYWPSYIVEELYKQAKETGKNCIIESIRAEWEALALKWKDKRVRQRRLEKLFQNLKENLLAWACVFQQQMSVLLTLPADWKNQQNMKK